MAGHRGGCLCGKTRYETTEDPLWVTICFCRFCQRATGSDRMIEPIFERDAFRFTAGQPAVFTLPSDGSGQDIHVHFCSVCGTKLALTFARWPDRLGIYIGTLDDPGAVQVKPENSKHIFTSEARPGTIVAAGIPTYERHATKNDGTPLTPVIHDLPTPVGH
jgi:hypothetical protein